MNESELIESGQAAFSALPDALSSLRTKVLPTDVPLTAVIVNEDEITALVSNEEWHLHLDWYEGSWHARGGGE
jgi:hypothetical protein